MLEGFDTNNNRWKSTHIYTAGLGYEWLRQKREEVHGIKSFGINGEF